MIPKTGQVHGPESNAIFDRFWSILGPHLGSLLVQKWSQNGGWKNGGILALRAPWPPDSSQESGLGPQDRFGPQNDPKMNCQNYLKMEPLGREIIAIHHVISVRVGTAKAIQKWSQKKLARVPSMQITFFRSKTAAQYPDVPSELERFH